MIVFVVGGIQIAQTEPLEHFRVHLLPGRIREGWLHRPHFLFPHGGRLGRHSTHARLRGLILLLLLLLLLGRRMLVEGWTHVVWTQVVRRLRTVRLRWRPHHPQLMLLLLRWGWHHDGRIHPQPHLFGVHPVLRIQGGCTSHFHNLLTEFRLPFPQRLRRFFNRFLVACGPKNNIASNTHRMTIGSGIVFDFNC